MSLTLTQIGLNTADMAATLQLYTEAFGFQNTGGQALYGSLMEVQGLDSGARALVWWMLGSDPGCQLEFIHHSSPRQRPLRPDRSPADLGWCRFGIALDDFDAAIVALESHGVTPIAGMGTIDGKRHAAIWDPHIGIVVELIESGAGKTDQSLPGLNYVACSVSDLPSAQHYYGNVLGFEIRPLDRSSWNDAVWGMPDAQADGFEVVAGNVPIRILRYADPVGRPRPEDYRSSDQGFVNVAFGASSREPVVEALARLKDAGYVPPKIIDNGLIVAGYILDAERAIELCVAPDEMRGAMGFVPTTPFFGSLL